MLLCVLLCNQWLSFVVAEAWIQKYVLVTMNMEHNVDNFCYNPNVVHAVCELNFIVYNYCLHVHLVNGRTRATQGVVRITGLQYSREYFKCWVRFFIIL